MNPYAMLGQAGDDEQRRFLGDLQRWHDEMVVHQRFVQRLGQDGCSDGCPHAEGRRLWREARERLGPAANGLTFLRSCAGEAPPPAPPAPAPAPAGRAGPRHESIVGRRAAAR